jgi:hypothetical protein
LSCHAFVENEKGLHVAIRLGVILDVSSQIIIEGIKVRIEQLHVWFLRLDIVNYIHAVLHGVDNHDRWVGGGVFEQARPVVQDAGRGAVTLFRGGRE